MSTVINFQNILHLEIGISESESVVDALLGVVKNSCIIDNTRDNVVFKNYSGFSGFVADIIPLLKEALTSKSFHTYPNGSEIDYSPTFWIHPVNHFSDINIDIDVSMGEELPFTRFKNNRKAHREMELRSARNIEISYELCINDDTEIDGYRMETIVSKSIENILDFKSAFRKRYDEVHCIDESKYKRGSIPSQRFSISAQDCFFDGTYRLLKEHKHTDNITQFSKSLLTFFTSAYHVNIYMGKNCLGFKVLLSSRKGRKKTISTEFTSLDVMGIINTKLSNKRVSRLSRVVTDGMIVGWDKNSVSFAFEKGMLTESMMQKSLQAFINKSQAAINKEK